MNLLIIEFRAEIGFASSQELLRTPGLFAGREAQAAEAADIIERIRTDELIHVSSLRLYLGELAEVTIRTTDGGTVAGRDLLDRFWGGLVRWATVDQPQLVVERDRAVLEARIARHPDRRACPREFRAAALSERLVSSRSDPPTPPTSGDRADAELTVSLRPTQRTRHLRVTAQMLLLPISTLRTVPRPTAAVGADL